MQDTTAEQVDNPTARAAEARFKRTAVWFAQELNERAARAAANKRSLRDPYWVAYFRSLRVIDQNTREAEFADEGGSLVQVRMQYLIGINRTRVIWRRDGRDYREPDVVAGEKIANKSMTYYEGRINDLGQIRTEELDRARHGIDPAVH